MSFEAIPELGKSKGPQFSREDILAQQAGRWRTVAETIELGNAEVYDDQDKLGSEGVILEPGDQINVLLTHKEDSNRITVKIHNPKVPNRDKSYYFHRSQLEGKVIKLESGK